MYRGEVDAFSAVRKHMGYTVKKLAKIAGVSVRTLHHYDAIGLLRPARTERNGYRSYGDGELMRLQQILFFKELDFPLDEVKRILDAPGFDMAAALRDQRSLLEIRRKRLAALIRTIDRTTEKLKHGNDMEDDELYGSFSKEEGERYSEEAKRRWGHTEAYRQSTERYLKMTKSDLIKVQEENGRILLSIVAHMAEGARSKVVQRLIAKHYEALRAFYDPTIEIYRGLAEMYVADDRFAAFYRKIHPDLPEFLREAMIAFCDLRERKGG